MLSVTTWRLAPVLRLLNCTTAAGMTPPCASETTPCKELVDWAWSIEIAARKSAVSKLSPAKRLRRERRTKVLVNICLSSN